MKYLSRGAEIKVKKFEDLDIWIRLRNTVKEIYRVTMKEKFAKDWGLKAQITRAAVSIMSNIAEGFDGGSKAEFSRFLTISKRSLSEVQSQLYVALDLTYIDQKEFDSLYNECGVIKRMTTSFIFYLKGYKHNISN